MLKTQADGSVVAAVAGTDYLNTAILSLGPTGQGQTGSTQTLATSSTGTDFTITSSGDTHTFNLPFASAFASGKLSLNDWSVFNNKISSTSIDTSIELSNLLTDETGTGGALVFALEPSLQGFVSTASSTVVGDFTAATSVTTPAATTTSLAVLGITSSLLKTDSNGSVIPAIAGTDYLSSAITTLGGAYSTGQTGATQTFATGTPDTNIQMTITSSGDIHTFSPTWVGTLADARVADDLTISGGTINNTTIGVSTPSSAFFTGATTTSLGIYGILSSILKTQADGSVVAAVAGTDYLNTAILSLGPTGQGQTGSTQTLATSSTGTDFTITSSGDTHTFNLPFASAFASGKLSLNDWSVFNNKISSTSIDTSIELSNLLTDETGTGGALVFALEPSLQGFVSTASSTVVGDFTAATSVPPRPPPPPP